MFATVVFHVSQVAQAQSNQNASSTERVKPKLFIDFESGVPGQTPSSFTLTLTGSHMPSQAKM